MDAFGYRCSICGKPILGNAKKGGDSCLLSHKRHGVEIGRTIGHYDNYGGVIEDDVFSSKLPGHENSNSEIGFSEYDLCDSLSGEGRKLVNGKSIAISKLKNEYFYKIYEKQRENLKNGKPVVELQSKGFFEDNFHKEKFQAILDSFEDVEIKSGILACHTACIEGINDEELNNLPISRFIKINSQFN